MKTLVFNNGQERVILEYETTNGYHSFTTTTEEYGVHSKASQEEYAMSLVENDPTWLFDNPDKTVNDYIQAILDDGMYEQDFSDFEYDEKGNLTGWEYTGFGQRQDYVPSEIVELWNTYHLKGIEDNEDVDMIREIIKKYEISL